MKNLAPSVLRLVALVSVMGILEGCRVETDSQQRVRIGTETNLSDVERSRVVAKIGDQSITRYQLEQLIDQQASPAKNWFGNESRQLKFLEEVVRVHLLAREAERLRLDQTPESISVFEELMAAQMIKKLGDSALKFRQPTLTDSDAGSQNLALNTKMVRERAVEEFLNQHEGKRRIEFDRNAWERFNSSPGSEGNVQP